MEEFFDTFDIDGKFLGVKPKSYCHGQNPNCYHKPVWIWIINSKNEILLQKRAKIKKNCPDMWDTPSAGHVTAGEDLLSACQRETEEELGIRFPTNGFIFQKEFLSQNTWELGQIYLLKADIKMADFTLQKEEVSEVKWFNFDEFKKLLYSDKFVPYEKEYKDWVCKMLKDNFSV